MDSAFDDVQRLLASEIAAVSAASSKGQPRRGDAPTPTALKTYITQWTRSIRSMELRVPGSHYSGLSNQALLEVRRREGRDFDAWTVQIRQDLAKHLIERWRARGRLPSFAELEADAGEYLTDKVVKRVGRGGDDVLLEPLTDAYAKRKRKLGKGGKPIGVLTGKWITALARRGFVLVKR